MIQKNPGYFPGIHPHVSDLIGIGLHRPRVRPARVIGGNTPGLLAVFFSVVRPPLFGLWRGPITPPDPAMVRMDRKDLNSEHKNTIGGTKATSVPHAEESGTTYVTEGTSIA